MTSQETARSARHTVKLVSWERYEPASPEHGGHEPRTFIAPKDVIEREVTPENEPVTLETRHRIATLAVGLEQVAAAPISSPHFLKLNDEPIPPSSKSTPA